MNKNAALSVVVVEAFDNCGQSAPLITVRSSLLSVVVKRLDIHFISEELLQDKSNNSW